MLVSCGKSPARITARDIKFPSRLPEGAGPKSVRVSIHLGGGGGVVEGLNVRVGSCFCCQDHSEAEVAFNKGTGFGSSGSARKRHGFQGRRDEREWRIVSPLSVAVLWHICFEYTWKFCTAGSFRTVTAVLMHTSIKEILNCSFLFCVCVCVM